MDSRVLNRDGFTLLEVLIAMVILSIAMLGTHVALSDRLIRDVGQADNRSIAMQLAADRIQMVQLEPNYGALETVYEKTETGMAGFPGFTRVTDINRSNVATTKMDFKTVTVTVTHARLNPSISRSVVVAAP
ncbi:MAG TPA: prepilin-type N-terminal cleavage/methylation domain-containing protein [Longimicrobium sp.]|jgi:prepilin-type N-terminal cleavage/methylation domain-containing protein